MPDVVMRDGQRLHVTVLGRGTPVLMVPGMGMHHRLWLPYIAPYLTRYRFYLPDLRNQGRSASVPFNQPDPIQNHAEDMLNLIQHFKLKDFHLVGYSLGASVCMHMQSLGGFADVRRYLNMDQSPSIRNRADWRHGIAGERQEEVFAQLHQLNVLLRQYPDVKRLAGLPAVAWSEFVGIVAKISGFPSKSEHSLWRALPRAALCLTRPLAYLSPIDSLSYMRTYLDSNLGSEGHDYRESLRNCRTPVTIMVGMRPSLYPPAGQMAIADYVRNSEIVRMENSTHFLIFDEPVRFTRELGRFLRA